MSELDGAARNPLRDPRDRRLPRVAGPCGLVLFGVTGDLARKKLMPAIYDLANRGLLPPGFALVGFARREWADQDFVHVVHDAVKQYARTPFREEVWDQLADGFRFVPGDFGDNESFDTLARVVADLDRVRGTGGNHAFYLSIPPNMFPVVISQLKRSGLSATNGNEWRRVVVEKPFGHDLKSARELNEILSEVFPPESVFRIDHYLGKETVQNILALRFANTLFEPIWNRSYVDHVQITMAEDIGIGGRAGYYDGIGAARDVIQNHLLQLLALTAMEEPVSFEAQSLRLEKTKVLSAVRIPDDIGAFTACGQYAGGWQGGEKVKGYLEEDGIPAHVEDRDLRRRQTRGRHPALGRRAVLSADGQATRTPGHRGRGRLPARAAPAVRRDRHRGARARTRWSSASSPTRVTMRFGSKVPGTAMEVRDVNMDFAYGESFTESSPGGVRTAAARRPARRPAVVPAARGSRAVVADPRPDRGALGQARAARALPVRWLGAALGRRDARARWAELETPVRAATMMPRAWRRPLRPATMMPRAWRRPLRLATMMPRAWRRP